jgi:Putative prokaryotic signal transducing protein
MAELFRTNDVALIAVTEALLIEAEIPYQVADRHSAVLDGSIRFVQMRVLVVDDRIDEARQLLRDADLGEWVG